MFQNYLKIALRSLLRQKSYTAINIIGLALGLTCTILLGLHIADDISFDKFHSKADRIYRFTQWDKTHQVPANTAPGWLESLTTDIPHIQAGTRLYEHFGEILLTVGTTQVYDKTVKFADANVFEIFDFPLVQGNMRTALVEPYSAVISETAATRYFGTTYAIGKVIRVDNKFDMKITGVMRDVHAASHLQFEILGSMETVKREFALPNAFQSLFWNPFLTYILLKEGTSAEAAQTQVALLKNKLAKDIPVSLALHPLSSIHLVDEGAQSSVNFLAVVLAIILGLACINYTNLATARYSNRAREVGVRKTLGAKRGQLAVQFWGESVILTAIALAVSLLAVELLLPSFNTLTGKHLSLFGASSFNLALVGCVLAALLLIVSVFAGVYPALMLSNFKPVEALKSKAASRFQGRAGSISLRSVLVVVQFSLSIAMIIGTLVVQNQLQYIVSKNVGFDREQMLIVKLRGKDDAEQQEVLKSSFRAVSGVQGVSMSSSIPGKSDVLVQMPIELKYLASGDKDPSMKWLCIDEHFLTHYGISIKEGRNFNSSETDKQSGFLINEAAAKKLKWENGTAVGKEIGYNIGEKASGWHIEKTGRVLGVVKDFNVGTLRSSIEPLLIHYYPNFMGTMSIKLSAGNPAQILASLERAWKQAVPNRPFEYTFLDDEFNNAYKREQQLRSVVAVFAAIAIAISCLGLLGLAAFTAEQRTKEIGIRKVLGASVASIIGLLTKDFLKLVGIAIVLATPLAYWVSSKWLEDFAYKIDLGAGVFVLAGSVAIVVAFLTVAGQSWRAAEANPVQSLRSE
ncbi:MAG: FtsX-like permease family protein [Candidatus Kapaibacterium sp.]|nr:MAG: FtsX-like permease family protein [Candidatus Kapabacteria bacterium]